MSPTSWVTSDSCGIRFVLFRIGVCVVAIGWGGGVDDPRRWSRRRLAPLTISACMRRFFPRLGSIVEPGQGQLVAEHEHHRTDEESESSLAPECRRARDTFWDVLSPQNACARRQPLCSGTPCGRAVPDSPFGPPGITAPTNGLTACRMRSAYCLRGFGTDALSPRRQHARADAYPGLLASRFALPWRAAEVCRWVSLHRGRLGKLRAANGE